MLPIIEQTGPPEVIKVGELPRPVAGPGQVLLRVHAVALNPIDLYIRSGLVAMPLSFPYIIGCDVAGTVEETGAGCTRFQNGDRVWGSNQGLLGRQGVAAEYVAVDEAWLYPTPALLPDTDAAAMALVGITAHLGLFQFGQLKAGEVVYVPGGTGGVGSMVVQMAKAARSARRDRGRQPRAPRLLPPAGRRSGHQLPVPTTSPRDYASFHQRESTSGMRPSASRTSRSRSPCSARTAGLILIAGRTAKPALPLGAFYPRNCAIFGFAMFNASADQQRRCAGDIVRWIEEGVLKPIVGRAFPLSAAVDAVRFLEEKTLKGAGTLTGKVVITIE